MSEHHRREFLSDIASNALNAVDKFLAIADAESSESWEHEHRRRIFDVVLETVGLEELNSIVFTKLKDWIVTEVAKEVEAFGDDDSTECCSLKFSLATLYDSQGRHEEAEQVSLQPINCAGMTSQALDFPKLGVKLYQGIHDFYDRCGSKEDLEGLTTTQVCDLFIKPQTESYQSSYCKMLESQHHPAIGIATVFISHAWKYRFLDVICALEYHFRDQPDIIIWFDLFSNNQHNTNEFDFDWWCNTFKSAIQQFGHTVMVLAPWSDPIPLTRGW